MAGFYESFTSTRTTEPDFGSLVAQLRALDATAGVIHDAGTQIYRIKKNSAWTNPQRTAAQNAIDAAPAVTSQLVAQSEIDGMSIFQKAILLTLLDEINRLRTQPTTTFTTISPATAIAAVRTKAGTL